MTMAAPSAESVSPAEDVGCTKSIEFDVELAISAKQREGRTGYDLRPS
jgi:hypothetical protein